MPTYIGFSTKDVDRVRSLQINNGVDGGAGSLNNPIVIGRKFRTVDQDTVLQDFINSLNITQGQLPGRPEYGTTLWTFIFEPNNFDTVTQIQTEIQRMAGMDSRIILNTISAYPQGNGILVEIEMAVRMFNDPMMLQLYFDQQSGTASLL